MVPAVAYPVLVGQAEAAGWAADMGGGALAALEVVLAGADWDEPECNCGGCSPDTSAFVRTAC